MTRPLEGDRARAALAAEFARLEERAAWSAQGQFEQYKAWSSVNLWLGTATAVTAAVSGGLTLAADALNVIGGALALMSAAGGAVLTTVNASSRANRATTAANAYLEIQTAARQTRLIDLPDDDLTASRQTLAELTARCDEQNKSAEPIARRAYLRAKRNMDDGGQTYTVDRNNGEADG